jgi:hypothetical protein
MQMKKITSIVAIVLIILAVLSLIFITPLVVIWALNTLFPVLAIPFVWQTWLSVTALLTVIKFSVK